VPGRAADEIMALAHEVVQRTAVREGFFGFHRGASSGPKLQVIGEPYGTAG
jgi:hypothetical protein